MNETRASILIPTTDGSATTVCNQSNRFFRLSYTKPFILLLLAVAFLSNTAFAKRMAPPKVTPVVDQGIAYKAPNNEGRRGYIEAWDVQTNQKLWDLTIFTNSIDPKLEEDVQWIFIKSLEIENGELIVTSERKKSYRVDLKTKTVTPIESKIAAHRKRFSPATVAPVIDQGISYKAPNKEGRRAYIEAWDVQTNQKLWDLTIFTNSIDPKLEEDVQWVFIRSLTIVDGKLFVMAENNKAYQVDLKTKAVIPIGGDKPAVH